MKNGFIIEAFSWVVEIMKFVSLVEYFKKFAIWLLPSPSTTEEKRKRANFSIDVFVVLKWIVLVFMWWKKLDNVWWIGVTIYLIVTNIHTYFYYHVWTTPSNLTTQQAVLRAKRRLVNLLVAVAFSNTCFSYLYAVRLFSQIKWADNINSVVGAVQLSWGNALAGSFGSATPLTNHAIIVLTCQQVLTFVFVAIILSKTIPSD